jgi:hypothetical protein
MCNSENFFMEVLTFIYSPHFLQENNHKHLLFFKKKRIFVFHNLWFNVYRI